MSLTFGQRLAEASARISALSSRNLEQIAQLEDYLSLLDRLIERHEASQSMPVASRAVAGNLPFSR